MHGHSATFTDLEGASVFITGGGSGIGAALTRGFLEQGARVAFIGRSDYSGLVETLEAETGRRPLFLQGDVTDTSRLQGAMDAAEEAHGPLDVLVNNAAHDLRTDPDTVTEAQWDEMMAVNFRHYFFACQRAARSMKGRGGRIVNFSSIAHIMGVPDLAVYAPANAGIEGLTRTLARNWGAEGIRVNSVLPGMVLTERQLELWISDEARDRHVERQCLKESLVAADMVGPVLFLASDASRMMTGQSLIIDGGFVTTP